MFRVATVIDLAKWRRRRSGPEEPAPSEGGTSGVAGLEVAVERLRWAVERSAGASGRVDAATETEILAIIGELASGSIDAATRRAHQLAQSLRAGPPTKGVMRTRSS